MGNGRGDRRRAAPRAAVLAALRRDGAAIQEDYQRAMRRVRWILDGVAAVVLWYVSARHAARRLSRRIRSMGKA